MHFAFSPPQTYLYFGIPLQAETSPTPQYDLRQCIGTKADKRSIIQTNVMEPVRNIHEEHELDLPSTRRKLQTGLDEWLQTSRTANKVL